MTKTKIDLKQMSISELNEYAIASKNICDFLNNNASINSTNQFGNVLYDNNVINEMNKFKHINYLINAQIKNKLLEIID